jgi:hypothetical protein
MQKWTKKKEYKKKKYIDIYMEKKSLCDYYYTQKIFFASLKLK